MDKQLRKRLEEAAHESSMGELIFGREVSCWIGGFKEGGEWMFKEAIALAKEWLDEHGKLDKLDLVEFDMEMNKLWEEQK